MGYLKLCCHLYPRALYKHKLSGTVVIWIDGAVEVFYKEPQRQGRSARIELVPLMTCRVTEQMNFVNGTGSVRLSGHVRLSLSCAFKQEFQIVRYRLPIGQHMLNRQCLFCVGCDLESLPIEIDQAECFNDLTFVSLILYPLTRAP